MNIIERAQLMESIRVYRKKLMASGGSNMQKVETVSKDFKRMGIKPVKGKGSPSAAGPNIGESRRAYGSLREFGEPNAAAAGNVLKGALPGRGMPPKPKPSQMQAAAADVVKDGNVKKLGKKAINKPMQPQNTAVESAVVRGMLREGKNSGIITQMIHLKPRTRLELLRRAKPMARETHNILTRSGIKLAHHIPDDHSIYSMVHGNGFQRIIAEKRQYTKMGKAPKHLMNSAVHRYGCLVEGDARMAATIGSEALNTAKKVIKKGPMELRKEAMAKKLASTRTDIPPRTDFKERSIVSRGKLHEALNGRIIQAGKDAWGRATKGNLKTSVSAEMAKKIAGLSKIGAKTTLTRTAATTGSEALGGAAKSAATGVSMDQKRGIFSGKM